jgi:HSP20 family protein
MNAQITRWNPFKELDEFQNRLASFWSRDPFETNGKQDALAVAAWTPRVDIAEDDKEFLIKAELPEVKKDDVHVSVEDGVLTFSGERKMEKEEKGRKFHRVERQYGSFLRSFALPPGAAGDKVNAEFKDGVLKVHVPKDAKALPKAIEVKVG